MVSGPRKAIIELGSGAALAALSAGVLWAFPSADTLEASDDTKPFTVYQPTRRATAPPLALGRDYDTDSKLAERADPIASYRWTVRLDETLHRIHAKGTIVWKNSAHTPAHELYFHLYLNAFKNSETLFLRSPFGAGRSGDKAEYFGYIDVKKMIAPSLGGRDLWAAADKHTPGDPKDETDIRVPLPAPVPPEGTLSLEVEFEAQLPQIVERTGYMGSYHFVAQWFPKLAKREQDGTWVHFPFHPQAEFYADFGDYAVTVDVPEHFVVGATGRRVSSRRQAGRSVHHYEQNDVTDFAWVAWDGFRTQEEQIAGVAVRLLYPPTHAAAAERTLQALRGALPHFNELYGRYPYPTLTVVHPPDEGLNSGGMEYPTLITTGGRWYTPYLGIREVELVTVHELAHQWFYGLVATDEHSWPFLDEGLTSYAEAWAMQQLYGNGSLMHNALGTLALSSFTRAIAVERGLDDIVAKPAREFTGFSSLGALVYQRTATTLETLARVYGRAKLQRALGRYARYYRFRHPTPAHLVAALAESIGESAAKNFEKAIFERGFVDYVVRSVDSVEQRSPVGIFDRANGERETIAAAPAGAERTWLSQAVITRHGSLEFPVDIELSFADGSRVRQHWNGEGATHTVRHTGKSRLVGVHVDPDLDVMLDENLFNNAMTRPESSMLAVRELSLYAAQLGLTLLGP